MYNLLALLLLFVTTYEVNTEPAIGQTDEAAENGYRPGFTNDDLMKLVFQRYGKSEAKGDSEKVNKREALETVSEDEEDINQKRAYPRPVPGSNSILAKHNEAYQYLPWNNLQKRYGFDRSLRSFDRSLRAFDRSLRTPGGYAFDHLARMKKGGYAFDHLARMRKANYDFDHLARMRKANYDFDHLARMKKGGYAFDHLARM